MFVGFPRLPSPVNSRDLSAVAVVNMQASSNDSSENFAAAIVRPASRGRRRDHVEERNVARSSCAEARRSLISASGAALLATTPAGWLSRAAILPGGCPLLRFMLRRFVQHAFGYIVALGIARFVASKHDEVRLSEIPSCPVLEPLPVPNPAKWTPRESLLIATEPLPMALIRLWMPSFRILREEIIATLDDEGMAPTRKYLAFDIETASTSKEDWHSCRPLGISCAATLLGDSGELRLWHGGDRANPTDRMSREEAAALVRYLKDRTADGYTTVTWNGLGFDFDILAEESGMFSDCRRLAIAHVDMMFHAFCTLGHAVGMDAAARGMGVPGKLAGMTGASAPVLWAEGRRDEVLQYVAQDARTTLEVALKCESLGAMRWIARSGKLRSMGLPRGWLTVEEAGRLPEPDTSWMDEPWSRSRFTGWMQSSPPSDPDAAALPGCREM